MIFVNLYIRENVKINIIFDIQLTCDTSERACTATFHTTLPHLSQRGSACPLGTHVSMVVIMFNFGHVLFT